MVSNNGGNHIPNSIEGYTASKGINKNIPKNPLSINKKLAIIKNKANGG
jgi:hypothetical protein